VALSETDLRLMQHFYGLHLEYPFFGSRRLVTLMRRMGIEARHRKARTSPGNRQHKVYPYLLKDVAIVRQNQPAVENPAPAVHHLMCRF
jgi:putative transposase